jgi:hypothetical protein
LEFLPFKEKVFRIEGMNFAFKAQYSNIYQISIGIMKNITEDISELLSIIELQKNGLMIIMH